MPPWTLDLMFELPARGDFVAGWIDRGVQISPQTATAANCEGFRLRVALRRPSGLTSLRVTADAGQGPRQFGKFGNPDTLIWKGFVKKLDPGGEAGASSTMNPADIR